MPRVRSWRAQPAGARWNEGAAHVERRTKRRHNGAVESCEHSRELRSSARRVDIPRAARVTRPRTRSVPRESPHRRSAGAQRRRREGSQRAQSEDEGQTRRGSKPDRPAPPCSTAAIQNRPRPTSTRIRVALASAGAINADVGSHSAERMRRAKRRRHATTTGTGGIEMACHLDA